MLTALHNELIASRATLDANGFITGYAALRENEVIDADSYKSGHPYLLAPGTQNLTAYFSSRGGRYRYTCFNGLQPFMLQHLCKQITMQDVNEAEEEFLEHGDPFYRPGWERIVTHYDGRLPLRICAVPEGTVVPTGNALFTVKLTTPDPLVAWLPGWFETQDVRIWYPTTVATRGFYVRERGLEAAVRTVDDPMTWLDYMMHCFGGRGASSRQSARIGGCAHLINFKGSDTMVGSQYAKHFYGARKPATSIPAAEHSVICSWQDPNRPTWEGDFYEHFVRTWLYGENDRKIKYPMAACVSDTIDYFNAIENLWFGEHLHNLVKNSGGKLIMRPDSGKPAEVDTRSLQIEERKIGMRRNSKDFKVGPSYFGFIQGDGVDDESVPEVLHEVMSKEYSVQGINFGWGGGGIQDMTRDTQKFKLAASAVQMADGTWRGIRKNPKTDPTKASRALINPALVREKGQWETVEGPRMDDQLVPVFENGRVLKTYTFEEVRANARKALGI